MGEQTQTAGAGAVAIQIGGDRNTVTIIRAGAELKLNRLHTRKDLMSVSGPGEPGKEARPGRLPWTRPRAQPLEPTRR
jgi:hypothetical protein